MRRECTPIWHVHVADQWFAGTTRQDLVNAAHADAEHAGEHGRLRIMKYEPA